MACACTTATVCVSASDEECRQVHLARKLRERYVRDLVSLCPLVAAPPEFGVEKYPFEIQAQAIALDLELIGGGHIPPWLTPDEPRATSRRALSLAAKQVVLERDEYTCTNCGSPDRPEVDHIVPVARGGGNEIENLRVLCHDCNASKGAKLDSEWVR